MGSYERFLYYGWKRFTEDEDRPEKPRRYGLTEMRSPDYLFLRHGSFQDIMDSIGEFVDGVKFSGGSQSLTPSSVVKEITDLAHRHNMYVSSGDWGEHLLRSGPASFRTYLEECRNVGFDAIELNTMSLKLPEEVLLRFVRLIKSFGLKARPVFAVNFDSTDIPAPGDRAFGAYIAPVQPSLEKVEDVDLLRRKLEGCLDAGADMIMIDADDVCMYPDSLRADIRAKIIRCLGLDKTMVEASDVRTLEWFIKHYGPKVNLFVDHSEVMNLERLRSPFFLM
ncbi:hypothetical protein LUZ61_012143 [Rhynchospora tenuis]|uniref:Phosphosulfolactate synthase n=1 Tax=Rhynchospora tenuis TaxID=198213 RepID=A0AAD6A2H8_9POAL|nr:hypothetical protein LUZ61_012143 [Rhynchospora tenuis]